MSLSETDLTRFVGELAAVSDRWRHLVRHSSDARLYEQIWDDDDVNAWVICWSDAQDTGFHDHDDSAAAILGIEGCIEEDRLRLGAAAHTRAIGPGTTVLVPPTAIHRVRHVGVVPAITIHAYSPPLRRTGAYRVGAGGELERAAQSLEQELRAQAALAG
jgi:mannose-6-phosphate isomerase-like protein (cupin superfamily)